MTLYNTTRSILLDIRNKCFAPFRTDSLFADPKAFRTIIDASPDSLIFVDPISMNIIDCNETAAEMNGYIRKELIGQPITIMHPDEYNEDSTEFCEKVRKAGRMQYESVHIRKDGTTYPVEVSISMMKFKGKEILFGLDRDITERKMAEQQLWQVAQDQHTIVEELERQNRESTLIADMAHRLESCHSEIEAYEIINSTIERLFDDQSIAIYNTNEQKELTCVIAHGWPEGWSPKGTQLCLTPDARLTLVSGRKHLRWDLSSICHCSHAQVWAENPNECRHGCYPLTDQNEMFGLFHIQFEKDSDLERWDTLCERLAGRLSLILANLKLRELLKQQAIRDPLTQLFNRRYMEETVTREISRVSRKNQPLCVIEVDIDHFKNINDTYGHPAGDQVLKAFADHLVASVRREDVVCRYGGEEFVIILPEMDCQEAKNRMDRVQQSWNWKNSGEEISFTFSAGIASFPQHGDTCAELIKMADNALYHAKRLGRHQVVVMEQLHEAISRG